MGELYTAEPYWNRRISNRARKQPVWQFASILAIREAATRAVKKQENRRRLDH